MLIGDNGFMLVLPSNISEVKKGCMVGITGGKIKARKEQMRQSFSIPLVILKPILAAKILVCLFYLEEE